MNKNALFLFCLLLGIGSTLLQAGQPWDNGRLKVSDNGRYLVHENGAPFFWLGETAWLLTSRLQREEIDFYLKDRAKKGYNVVQLSVFHYYPQFNIYGQCATPYGYDFRKINQEGQYGYWDHVDYAIDAMAKRGMYAAIVCTWGSEVVKGGKMTIEDAKKYGRFLAERYKDKPNIIWLIGGDVNPEGYLDLWNAMARTIKSIDPNHLMTYHPVGRTSSHRWFHQEDWLDFNMFQSGHRRYGQNFGQTENYGIEQDTEEDNWRYVEAAYAMNPKKPVIDGEPSYEAIPQGLRSGDEPYWTPAEIRRYAYWSVFAGSFGHTYGHNSVMQFYVPSIVPSFSPTEPWWEGIHAPASSQMQYLKHLMCRFPFTQDRPDSTFLTCAMGEKHDRLAATRGDDYALVYTYTNRAISLDLDQLPGAKKCVFWMLPETGQLDFVGTFSGKQRFLPTGGYGAGKDKVLIVFDASKSYLNPDESSIIQ